MSPRLDGDDSLAHCRPPVNSGGIIALEVFTLNFDREYDDGFEKRDFNAEQRRQAASRGQAMPDGSYPIVTKEDLANAIQSYGRAKNKDAVKRHIISRARALGAIDMLPESWNVSKIWQGRFIF